MYQSQKQWNAADTGKYSCIPTQTPAYPGVAQTWPIGRNGFILISLLGYAYSCIHKNESHPCLWICSYARPENHFSSSAISFIIAKPSSNLFGTRIVIGYTHTSRSHIYIISVRYSHQHCCTEQGHYCSRRYSRPSAIQCSLIRISF